MKRPLQIATIIALVCSVYATDRTSPLKPEELTPERVHAALEQCMTYLLEAQNPDGSWGGSWDSIFTWSGGMWSNPESHRSWRVATSGLCCLALLEVEPTDEINTALERGLVYLQHNVLVKRPNEWDTMNSWAHIYGLQALASAYSDERFAAAPLHEAIRQAAQTNLAQLAYHQSLSGGWGYLEFNQPRTARPQWATSFTTAAGVIALLDARHSGLEVDEGLLRRAVKAVRRCRLPNGAYTYSVRVIPHPRTIGSINRINGSLSRIQVCNLALLMAGDDITEQRLKTGIGQFFHEHRFLDIATGKPIPHETYYQNSGYFYMFGHYYAARVIELLPPEDQATCWPRLQYEVIKMQGSDGAIWDYDMHAYDKPYGTAYAIMVLQRSIQGMSADENINQPPVAP
ncbi:MAG: hypothetical protein ABIG44_19725 [Planctomycetota bacterium]